MKSLKNKRGMTLVEIMIVLAIIGSIAALLLPRVTGGLDKSKVKEAGIQLSQISQALQLYYTDCGKYPESLQGLVEADASCNNWGPEAYLKKAPKDPWQNDFVYELEGGNFMLKSLGKDKREGGSGFDKDIVLDE